MKFTKVKNIHRIGSLFKTHLSDKLSQDSIGPIFNKLSPCGRYLIVDYWFHLFFPTAQGTLQWQPILWLKLAKSADAPSFVALAFVNGVEYRNSDFKKFICNDLATLWKNLVNFSPVTPEFKTVECALVDQQFGYAAQLLHLAGISTEFSGAITTQFCFSYSLGGVAAMPRWLHARLCHAFLVAWISEIK